MPGFYRRFAFCNFLLGCSFFCWIGAAQGAGFYLQEQSATALGSAYSGGVTNTQDASTLFYNPAGMTALSGTHLQAGVINLSPVTQLSDKGSTITVAGPTTFAAGGGNGGNPYDVLNLVPHLYVTRQINQTLWLGMAITVPYGLSEAYNAGWFGRYNATKSQLKVVDIQPSIAYRLNGQWAIGGGLDLQYAWANLEANPSIAGSGSAVSQLRGHDWATGMNFGIQYHPDRATTLGLTYRSRVGHDLVGHIRTTAATVTNIPARANLDLPDHVTFGAARKLGDKWTLQGQVSWIGWSQFHDITVASKTGTVLQRITEDYDDSFSYAAGAEYAYNRDWTLRGGMQYDQTPTNSHRDTRVPDGDRTWLAAGATYHLSPGVGLNLGGAYLWVNNEAINVTSQTGSALGSSSVKASSDSHVAILGLDLSYAF